MSEDRTEQPDGLASGPRIQELELASVEQAEVISNLEDALNDMNIGTANTESRLNLLETIAIRQKQVNHIFCLFGPYRSKMFTIPSTIHSR